MTEEQEGEERELKDTQQELMLELKIKTDELLKKFKAQAKKTRVSM
jgi:hypothetical protein